MDIESQRLDLLRSDEPLFGVYNPGFEMGATNYWNIGADHLPIRVDGRDAAEGAYSLKMAGTWTNGWSFNQAYQVLHLFEGDVITARAKINVKNLQASATNGWIAAGIKLEQEGTGFSQESALHADISNTGWTNLEFTTIITNEGWFVFRCMVAGDSKGGENFCDVNFDEVRVSRWPVKVYDGGFESGASYTNYWGKDSGALAFTIATNIVSSGSKSLRMSGGWSGWGWNQVYQVVHLRTGDVVRGGGRVYLDKLDTTAGWVVAGIKLEKTDGKSGFEHVYDKNASEDSWKPLGFTAVITNAGEYVFRCMVCGDSRAGKDDERCLLRRYHAHPRRPDHRRCRGRDAETHVPRILRQCRRTRPPRTSTMTPSPSTAPRRTSSRWTRSSRSCATRPKRLPRTRR